MDPFTAVCNAITAYVTFATAEFNATPPDQQAKLAAMRATFLEGMFAFAVKIHGDSAAAIDTLKGLISKPSNPAPHA